MELLFINYRRLLEESIALFLSARKLGYKILLVAPECDERLLGYVDHYVQADTSSRAVLEDLKIQLAGRPIKAVVLSTETSIGSSAWLARALGLSTLSEEAVLCSRDKYSMRVALADPRFKFMMLEDLADLPRVADQIGYPCVLKPTNASGSMAIHKLYGVSDVQAVLNRTMEGVANPLADPLVAHSSLRWIVETMLQGEEYSVEGFVHKGKVTVIGVTTKTITEPYALEIEHIFPAPLESEIEAIIIERVKEFVTRLQLDNCSFHLEGKVFEGDFFFIETAARPAGARLASHMLPLATGESFFANLIRVSCGEPPLPMVPVQHAGVRVIVAPKEGVLKGYKGLDEVLAHPFTQHIFYEQSLGTNIVLPPRDYRKQILLSIVGAAPDYKSLEEHFAWVEKTLTPIIEPVAVESALT